jgi:IS5 family transposase
MPATAAPCDENHPGAWLHSPREGTSPGGRELKRHPTKRARRWIVEVAHSWFNRFRKLLVRYEKLERSFVALNHLAAAIITFRKVPLKVNIIYG